MFSLSVIVPNYNGRRHLERLLPSIARLAPPGTQVLLVDDASIDDSAAWTRRHFPRIEVVAAERNGGFCAAVNAGLARATGRVVELLNNDTEVLPGWPDACLRHFADPSVGSVAPLVLQMNDPERIDSAGQEYHVCGWAYDRGHGQRLSDAFLTKREVFGPSGSSGFYRREALARTGGLLPEYGAYFEDTDLAFRLRWAGYRCIYEPATRVLHAGSSTYGKQSPRTTRSLARNEELAFWINLPPRDLMVGLVPHLAFQLVRLVRHATTGRLWPYLCGKWEALQAWGLICRRRREARGLAPKQHRTPTLGTQKSWDVLGRGVNWLRRRCA
jgi:GT2 family glycosyltransferase